MVTGVVYLATNTINHKKYVGVTTNFKRRKAEHKSNAKTGSSFLFHKAIRKYGWENFTWEVLAETSELDVVVNVVEPELIKKYNTFYKNRCGYNMTLGGVGINGLVFSEETKAKIRLNRPDVSGKNNPMYGKPSANRGKKTWIFGKHHTEEAKEKISRANRGKKLTEEDKFKKSLAALNKKKVQCTFCPKLVDTSNIFKHERACKND